MKRRRRSPRERSSKPAKLVWTNRALSDLESIGDYIARDKPAAALRWIAGLMAAAERAAMAQRAGRRVPELGRDELREVFKRTYRIVYRVGEDRIEVLTVFQGRQLLPDEIGR